MEDKIYPAIYESTSGELYLYLDTANYHFFASARWRKADGIDVLDHANDKNITHEYLQNTYGEVLSPGHAEFIIELAVNAGFEVADDDYEKGMVIEKYCKGGELAFFYTWENSIGQAFIAFSKRKDAACNDGEKQITIPLPPKAETKKWTPDFYELGELPKHFDCVCNKCGGKCCTGQCDKQELSEWPQVGDKVCWSNGCYSGVVKARHWNDLWVMESDGEFSTLYIDDVSKPKTPEDELREDLVILACSNSIDYQNKIDVFLNKYDIKKKPQ